MKSTTVCVGNISLSGITPQFDSTFGQLAVILPSANFDPNSSERISREEREQTLDYLHDVAGHLFNNMSGHDFRMLSRAMSDLG